MPITVLSSSGNKLDLVVEGYPLALVNAVRRACILYTPMMAVDEVYVIENNSVLYDEILAHRLAMIPLVSEEAVGRYKRPEDCGEDDSECSTKIYLTSKADSETGSIWVYSREIKSDDPAVKPVSDNIPIVLLAPGQSVSLEAKVKMGYGIEHAKYIPVTVSVVRYYPKVEVSEDCTKAAEVCPKHVFEVDSGKVRVANEVACILCEECVNVCGDKVKITSVEGKYIFEVESVGVMRPKTILREAVKSLRRKVEEFEKKIEVLSS